MNVLDKRVLETNVLETSVLDKRVLESNVLASTRRDGEDNSKSVESYIKETATYNGQGILAYTYTKINEVETQSELKSKYVWYDEKWNKKDVMLCQEFLKKLFPSGKSEHLLNIEKEINLNANDYGITSNNILAHYLGQAHVETGGFSKNATSENGYYSSLEIVAKAFGTSSNVYAKCNEQPGFYLKNPINFLNMAYANKGGNGDEASGDGYKYRGRGYFQLTLRGNYNSFNEYYKEIDSSKNIIETPDLLVTNISLSIISSLWYFQKYTIKVILKYTGSDDIYYKTITKTINAAALHLEKRKAKYEEAKLLLSI